MYGAPTLPPRVPHEHTFQDRTLQISVSTQTAPRDSCQICLHWGVLGFKEDECRPFKDELPTPQIITPQPCTLPPDPPPLLI